VTRMRTARQATLHRNGTGTGPMGQDSTIRRRELGLQLRAAMEAADWSGKRIAEWLGFSETAVSRMLTGHRSASAIEVAAVLAVCRVTGSAREELLSLCTPPSVPGLFHIDGRQRWAAFHTHAATATRIVDFSPLMVPWTVQSPDYTRAMVDALVHVPEPMVPEILYEWTKFQVAVMNIWDRSEDALTVFVHEGALRTPVGGPLVMSDQIHRLLRLSVRSGVSVRVIPSVVGAYSGLMGGFTFLEFDQFDPAIYQEDCFAGQFVEASISIRRCQSVIEEFDRLALDEGASRVRLGWLAVELYGLDVSLTEVPARD
jgi:hypothetical protein